VDSSLSVGMPTSKFAIIHQLSQHSQYAICYNYCHDGISNKNCLQKFAHSEDILQSHILSELSIKDASMTFILQFSIAATLASVMVGILGKTSL
jgi:hypothetical protein